MYLQFHRRVYIMVSRPLPNMVITNMDDDVMCIRLLGYVNQLGDCLEAVRYVWFGN